MAAVRADLPKRLVPDGLRKMAAPPVPSFAVRPRGGGTAGSWADRTGGAGRNRRPEGPRGRGRAGVASGPSDALSPGHRTLETGWSTRTDPVAAGEARNEGDACGTAIGRKPKGCWYVPWRRRRGGRE